MLRCLHTNASSIHLYEIFAHSEDGSCFLYYIVFRAVILGIRRWTGTILCSPTGFGTSQGMLEQQNDHSDQRTQVQQFSSPGSKTHVTISLFLLFCTFILYFDLYLLSWIFSDGSLLIAKQCLFKQSLHRSFVNQIEHLLL